MRGHVSDCVCCTQGNFALRGEFLSARAERNQRAAKGWAQDGRSAPIFAHPLDPRCGSYPLNIAQPFRRVKSEWQSKFPPGHFVVADFVSLASPGPGKARSLHRSSSPTQTRYAGLCVGGRLRRPVGRKISNGAVQKLRLALPSQRYRPVPAVGAAFGRPRAGLGPAPTERPESFPYFVGAAHGAARERPDGGIGPYKRSNAPSDTP